MGVTNLNDLTLTGALTSATLAVTAITATAGELNLNDQEYQLLVADGGKWYITGAHQCTIA